MPGSAVSEDEGYHEAPEVWHEVVKYRTHEHEAIVVMVCIMLAEPSSQTSRLALYCFIANSLTTLFDQVGFLLPGLSCRVSVEVNMVVCGDSAEITSVVMQGFC
jgi:hypothetical protein